MRREMSPEYFAPENLDGSGVGSGEGLEFGETIHYHDGDGGGGGDDKDFPLSTGEIPARGTPVKITLDTINGVRGFGDAVKKVGHFGPVRNVVDALRSRGYAIGVGYGGVNQVDIYTAEEEDSIVSTENKKNVIKKVGAAGVMVGVGLGAIYLIKKKSSK